VQGHHVTVFTSHYEAGRSFAETRDGTFAVRVYGDFLPRHAFGRFHIFFAILRALWLAAAVALAEPRFDVFVCDQVAAYLPALRVLRPWTALLFYCHFPDMLLSPRTSVIKRLYRLPFDLFEELSTSLAHGVVVNSAFTRDMVQRTFRLCFRGRRLQVLHPCIDVPSSCPAPLASASPTMLLSINRFERKKAIELALDAFAALKQQLPRAAFTRLHLVLAGGYDTRVAENVEYHAELKARAVGAGLISPEELAAPAATSPFVPAGAGAASAPPFQQVEAYASVTFVRSFSDEQKQRLLAACACVVYTPANEVRSRCSRQVLHRRPVSLSKKCVVFLAHAFAAFWHRADRSRSRLQAGCCCGKWGPAGKRARRADWVPVPAKRGGAKSALGSWLRAGVPSISSHNSHEV